MNKMPTNVKILMATMFLFAGLIIAGIFLNIESKAGLGANIAEILNENGTKSEGESFTGINDPVPCGDIDQDGLCNDEEPIYRTDPLNKDTDGDGFLDGEEIASGRDPIKPGPDDLLPTQNSQSLNITDKVSDLITGAFYAGDLDPHANPEIYNKSLTDISYEIIINNSAVLDPKNIPINKINNSSNSKEVQEKYLNTIVTIIENDLWGQLINEPRVLAMKFVNFNTEDQKNIANSKRYFNDKANHYMEVLQKVDALAVPPSWFNIHQSILTGLQTLVINHQALSQTNNDPLKSIAAVDNLMNLYQEVQPLVVSIVQNIKKNDLNPPNGPLWGLIYSLTNGI